MNPISLHPLPDRRRLGVAAVVLIGLAVSLQAGAPPDSARAARTQPLYLAYTVNNHGYLDPCG